MQNAVTSLLFRRCKILLRHPGFHQHPGQLRDVRSEGQAVVEIYQERDGVLNYEFLACPTGHHHRLDFLGGMGGVCNFLEQVLIVYITLFILTVVIQKQYRSLYTMKLLCFMSYSVGTFCQSLP